MTGICGYVRGPGRIENLREQEKLRLLRGYGHWQEHMENGGGEDKPGRDVSQAELDEFEKADQEAAANAPSPGAP